MIKYDITFVKKNNRFVRLVVIINLKSNVTNAYAGRLHAHIF
jgi:hypothetical protein